MDEIEFEITDEVSLARVGVELDQGSILKASGVEIAAVVVEVTPEADDDVVEAALDDEGVAITEVDAAEEVESCEDNIFRICFVKVLSSREILLIECRNSLVTSHE